MNGSFIDRFTSQPWTQRSINSVIAWDPRLDPTLVDIMLVSVTAGVLAGVAAHLYQQRRAGLPPSPHAVLWCFLAGWLALDALWQVSLWRNLHETVQHYWGKSALEKSLSAPDGELFSTIEEFRAHLPPRPVRVVFLSEFPYRIGRGAYHLYPHDVLTYGYPAGNHAPRLAELRPGDFILAIRRSDTHYSAAQGRVQVRDETRPAKLVHESAAGFLARIEP